MLKESAWVIFALGGLVGVLSRNRDASLPEEKDVARVVSRYADAMIEEHKVRFYDWKNR